MDINGLINIAQGFQTSVNIAYDLYNQEKITGFIPTSASLEVMEDILLSSYDNSIDRARILIGAYGKGKSHIILILMALLHHKEYEWFERILQSIKGYNAQLYEYVDDYLKSSKKLLPVIIQGSSTSLTQSFLGAIQRTLEGAELESLMPDTHFQAAVYMIDRWQEEYPETYQQFLSLLDEPVSDFRSSLLGYDVQAYGRFAKWYPSLTAGSEFNPFLGFDVVELYAKIVDALCERGYAGIFVVYDEFSKYLESSITKASIEDIKMLQDFAERCNRSKERQMHLLLISHKDITNYIDQLPKQKLDGWRGISERFKHVELLNDFTQIYEIIGTVVQKDDQLFQEYQAAHTDAFTNLLDTYKSSPMFSGLSAEEVEMVVYQCYPLHPVSTFILPRLSELVAQNERTLFTFLASNNHNTLSAYLRKNKDVFPLLTPDYLYDYFEPQLRKEPYTAEIRKVYDTAFGIVNRIGDQPLQVKIVKTLALIDIVNQMEKLAPLPETITEIFRSIINDPVEVTSALEELQHKQYVLYMKKSNNFLKLKNATGSDIQKSISDTVEKNRTVFDVKQILSESSVDQYLYPNQYNDDNDITRYFSFEFLYDFEFYEVIDWEKRIDSSPGDGVVFGIIPESNESIQQLVDHLQANPIQENRILFVLPKEQMSIIDMAYDYQAVKILREEAGEDKALLAEYNIYIEDLEEVIGAYVMSYTRPEMRASTYYHCGEKQIFHRKAQISQCISEICGQIYTKHPVINNESLNKTNLETIAINGRNKIVDGLLSNELEPMLGLSGTGQEVSFLRSALIVTGLLENPTDAPSIRLHDIVYPNLQYTIDVINTFFLQATNAKGTNFAVLYHQLTSPSQHIGLKKGVIPIFVAAVMRQYKEHLVIRSGDREFEITAEILNSINEIPSNYTVYHESWSEDKSTYIQCLERLFNEHIIGKEKEYNTFSYIVRAMQRWFISLSQIAKLSDRVFLGQGCWQDIDIKYIQLLSSLRNPDINAREFLFQDLPRILGTAEDLTTVVKQVESIKDFYDRFRSRLIDVLTKELVCIFDRQALSQSTLSSVLSDWRDETSEATHSHVFEGFYANMWKVTLSIDNDSVRLVERLCKAATGLRIDDWNMEAIDHFLVTCREFKEMVEGYDRGVGSNPENFQNMYRITFVLQGGEGKTRTFNKMEYSRQAGLLKNEISAAIEEMGQAISEDEKRQVLLEILELLC